MSYKSITKLITLVFAVLIIVQTFGFLLYSISGQYATAIDFEPNISIPGMSALFQQGSKPGSLLIDGSSIGNYVKTIYNYAIGSVGILSTVVMAFGGILWITAAGNTSRVDKAKATIAASLTGLVLTFSSYLILNMINPDLLRFEPLDIESIKEKDPPPTPLGQIQQEEDECIAKLGFPIKPVNANDLVFARSECNTICNNSYESLNSYASGFRFCCICSNEQTTELPGNDSDIGCCAYFNLGEQNCAGPYTDVRKDWCEDNTPEGYTAGFSTTLSPCDCNIMNYR